MIEPKIFYRKLDSLLSKIVKEISHKDFLFSILKEIEHTFGDDLRIKNGRMYEKNGDEYEFIASVSENITGNSITRMTIESDAVNEILRHEIYIFDSPSFDLPGKLNKTEADYYIPAALTFSNSIKSWIFVFELQKGWIREEIEICFHAVRTALVQRLFADELKNELTQAAMIQKSLLPQRSPQFEGYRISGMTRQAELVGGDLFDYHLCNENTLGVAVGDASGHGLPAALLVRDMVTGMRMGFEAEWDIINAFKKLNRIIYRSVFSTRFISLVYFELERNGNFNYINAGHPPPLLVSKNGVRELESTGLIFGAFPEIELNKSAANIENGDVLVLYTDGIIERRDRKGNEFGINRLKELLYSNKSKSPDDLISHIYDEIDRFSKADKPDDDATMVVVSRE